VSRYVRRTRTSLGRAVRTAYRGTPGGYTGFTEEELKSGRADLDAVSSSDKFMRPSEARRPQTKATTDAFVVLLIAVPLIGLGAAAAIFGSTYFP